MNFFIFYKFSCLIYLNLIYIYIYIYILILIYDRILIFFLLGIVLEKFIYKEAMELLEMRLSDK